MSYQATPDEAVLGRILLLPALEHISASSTIRRQGVPDGAFNHPVVVVGVDADRSTVEILQLTSFKGRADGPYPELQWRYRRVESAYHQGDDKFPVAELVKGKGFGAMLKTSWVNVMHRYRIEIEQLQLFRDRKRNLVQLSTKGIAVVTAKTGGVGLAGGEVKKENRAKPAVTQAKGNCPWRRCAAVEATPRRALDENWRRGGAPLVKTA